MTYGELLDKGKHVLQQAQIPEADINAWYLLEHVAHINRSQYYIRQSEQVNLDLVAQYLNLIELRRTHMPYQYITGEQEFMGILFRVNPSVLIPRQDTEILVEETLKKVKEGMQVLDICTGSGCIIVSLAMQGIQIHATASDISEDALMVARENAMIYNKDINFIKSNLFERIEGTFDIIVSNPPYISKEDMVELMEEVKDFEPHLALMGEEDGYYFYRRIIEDSSFYLKKDGYLFFEVGNGQAEAVKDKMEDYGFKEVIIVKDLAGLNRVVYGHR